MSARVEFQFDEVARLPTPDDNVAIACRTLDAGAILTHKGQQLTLPHTILEGHRFAIKRIEAGTPLLSWGLPFGLAHRGIEPGDYICNEWILTTLKQRHVKFALPGQANFENYRIPFKLDEQAFRPAEQVELYATRGTFEGFERLGGRGAGTRNYIVVLGTSSRAASYARALAERFGEVPSKYPNIDGVTAIAHTEGGGTEKPNNLEFTLRALAGFMVHPNVAAVLAVDVGTEAVTNRMLREFMKNYPLDHVTHEFLSIGESFADSLKKGEAIVRSWLDLANNCQRTTQPLEKLRIALQCGGSDAFSGVSANPLLGMVAKELVRHGGSANLAETDELIGAESYVLSKVRNLETARAFLRKIDRFQERVGWHGESAEGNPSGGNKFRGLYNIVIKSIGAARKKDPELRLDYVIDYAQPMTEPGFYFMDSPGNDLEGIAGQVAAGCTMILFTTGNGSITNFPFVPTIKIMTNSGRYNMLAQEMDVNAGRYLDGTPMEKLGQETFELMARIASGERSAGERVGFPQVQLWRDWPQTGPGRVDEILRRPKPNGKPLRVKLAKGDATAIHAETRKRERVGLIVPTSLCASQVARGIAQQLNASVKNRLTRVVALPHTEGCGASGGVSEQMYMRTMAGYLAHPLVARALVLEHGCEKTHNDAMRDFIQECGLDPTEFGWASIQLDGGFEKVTAKVASYFEEDRTRAEVSHPLSIAMTATETVARGTAAAFANLAQAVLTDGGSVVVPSNSPLLDAAEFGAIFIDSPRMTLSYGEPFSQSGLHIMDAPTKHFVETLTGLGATGIEVVVACVGDQIRQGHPLVPLIQVGRGSEVDVLEEGDIEVALASTIVRVMRREQMPKAMQLGNTDFQITRGLLGVSL